ncbi:hypothetical protein K474DRAFT_1679677, partial [Panus rudis PR-1116 ss-1]
MTDLGVFAKVPTYACRDGRTAAMSSLGIQDKLHDVRSRSLIPSNVVFKGNKYAASSGMMASNRSIKVNAGGTVKRSHFLIMCSLSLAHERSNGFNMLGSGTFFSVKDKEEGGGTKLQQFVMLLTLHDLWNSSKEVGQCWCSVIQLLYASEAIPQEHLDSAIIEEVIILTECYIEHVPKLEGPAPVYLQTVQNESAFRVLGGTV